YVVYDATRKTASDELMPSRVDRPAALLAPRQSRPASAASAPTPTLTQALDTLGALGAAKRAPAHPPSAQGSDRATGTSLSQSFRDGGGEVGQTGAQRGAPPPAAQSPGRSAESATSLQQSIARIHEACRAPPLSPPEYRALFELLAQEINSSGLQGA